VDPVRFRLAGEGRGGLVIDVPRRMHLNATDTRDGSWPVTPVEIAIGGFAGKIPAQPRFFSHHRVMIIAAAPVRTFRALLARAVPITMARPIRSGRLIRAMLEGEFGTAIRRPPFTATTRADLGRLPK
jgi:hypothetical protein